MSKVSHFLQNESIQRIFPEFEIRKEQLAMSEAVYKSLFESKNLLVEAGTGVGKSLAYLIPAALLAFEKDKKVVISTQTISLQNQLIQKDIPMVSKILGKEVKSMIALGSANYVCKRKFANVTERGSFGPDMLNHLKEFYAWEKETVTGIKSEYQGYASKEFWNQVTRESDNCLGKRCPNYSESYYFLEKRKWEEANILIVNHHLLASHIAGEGKLLPGFENLILDEAHHFPEIFGRSFAKETSFEEISLLLNFLFQNDKKPGLVGKIQIETLRKNLQKQIKAAVKYSEEFFSRLLSELGLSFQSQRITKKLKLDDGLLEEVLLEIKSELLKYKASLDPESEDFDTKEMILELDMSSKRLKDISETINLFRLQSESDRVYWVEPSRHEKNRFYSLHIQFLNSESLLVEKLFPIMESVVFTSATLSSAGNNFSYFQGQIGNPPSEELILNSPFDYEKNALLYMPKSNSLHDPGEDPIEYQKDILVLIPKILDLTLGNAFILFTSNKMMREVYEELKDSVPYPLFAQDIFGAEKAKREFLNTDNSVLLGVSTFWQGIDIKGDKLKSVIITKLPFQPPNEPALEAKIETLKKLGKNPFMEIQLPHAILTLKQGFGRLIRSSSDTGIISLLDPRVKTKFYGQIILDSLPPAKKVYSFLELKRGYSELPVKKK